jgi:hypothetical protein
VLNKKKLLITARDPASANDIIQILDPICKDGRFLIKVIAQEPAYSIILSKKYKFFNPSTDLADKIDKSSTQFIKALLNKEFLSFQPDCILTGISGLGYGVDEIAINICSKSYDAKSYSIQSYWGDLNERKGETADTIFVLDNFAKLVTEKRCSGKEIIITGSMQFDNYNNIDIRKEKQKLRTRFDVNNNTSIMALFGQPLFEFDWYRATLSSFFESMPWDYELFLIYKTHPKESTESIEWVKEEFSSKFAENTKVISDQDSYHVIAGADVTASIFSTIGYDLQNILVRSKYAFSLPIYLFYNKECRDWYREYTKLHTIPMSDKGMSLLVDNESKLIDALKMAMSNNAKIECHNNIKQYFQPTGQDATSIVIESLISSSTSDCYLERQKKKVKK